MSSAINSLSLAGRRPWVLYAQIEYAKALMDVQAFDETEEVLEYINKHVDRYPVLLPWFQEAIGQYHQIFGREDMAKSAFELAAGYAEEMGLDQRAVLYRSYLDLV